jgi:hypothetical protein
VESQGVKGNLRQEAGEILLLVEYAGRRKAVWTWLLMRYVVLTSSLGRSRT